MEATTEWKRFKDHEEAILEPRLEATDCILFYERHVAFSKGSLLSDSTTKMSAKLHSHAVIFKEVGTMDS